MKTKIISICELGNKEEISIDGGDIDKYIIDAGLGCIFNKYTRVGVNKARTKILFAKTKHIEKRLKELIKKKQFKMMFDERFNAHTYSSMENQYEVFEKVYKDIQWYNECTKNGEWIYYINAIDILYKVKEKL